MTGWKLYSRWDVRPEDRKACTLEKRRLRTLLDIETHPIWQISPLTKRVREEEILRRRKMVFEYRMPGEAMPFGMGFQLFGRMGDFEPVVTVARPKRIIMERLDRVILLHGRDVKLYSGVISASEAMSSWLRERQRSSVLEQKPVSETDLAALDGLF